MTAQTPTAKASGVSALLASFSTVPPPPQPSVKEDFLAVMLQALIGGPDGEGRLPAAQPAQEKPSPKEAAAPDPTSASLLPTLLAPPLPAQPKAPPHKDSSASDPAVASTAPTAQEKPSSTDTPPDPSAASLLLALLAAPLLSLPNPPSHKSAAPSVPFVPSFPPASSVAGSSAPVQTAGDARPGKPDVAENLPSLQAQAPPIKEAENKLPPTSGTSAADTSQRMSTLSERNENAGRTEQKLPPAAISAVSSADTGGPSPDGGAKSSLTFSWQDAPAEATAIIDLSAKAAALATPIAEATVDAPVRAASTAPLEQLQQMISREVMSVRQAGAQSLGVTLKLDTNTQLFLQLTTHNGLVQASVRCDRGNFAPEDGQWAQLQQSLARQNVELLPMTGGSNLSFQQSSQERPRHFAPREEFPGAGARAPRPPAQPRPQQKEQNGSRKNWESWA